MTTIKIRRGLEANRTSITPDSGELLYTTDEKAFWVGDGVTPGGNTFVDSSQTVTTKFITNMSTSGHNGLGVVMDGKLYTGTGNSANYANACSGRGGDNNNCCIGMDKLRRVIFPSSSPVVKTGGNYLAVAYALLENGDLYTWGHNNKGTAGAGHTSPIEFPVLVESNVVEVYDHPTNNDYLVNDSRLFIKKTDGFIYGTGYNHFGALGTGDTSDRTSFTQITSLGTDVENLWNLGATYGCTIVAKTDGTILGAGYNGYGCLGIGNTTNQSSFVDITSAWGGGPGVTLKQVSGGFRFFTTSLGAGSNLIMLLDDGVTTSVKTCGYNNWGQLGDGTITQRTTPVIPNIGAGRVAEISAQGGGANICFARKENNELYGWGYNANGYLGLGHDTNTSTPTLVLSDCIKLLSNGLCSNVYSFRTQTFIKRSDNQLYAAGYNSGGYLGRGFISTSENTFERVVLPHDFDVESVSGFTTVTFGRVIVALDSSRRKLYAWGHNGASQGLTDNSTTIVGAFIPMQLKLTENNF